MGNLKWDSILTEEYLSEMCKIHNRKELSDVTGIPITTIDSYLKRYGLTPALIDRNQKSFADILTKEFLLSVFPKHSITEIAKMVNGSRSVVDKYLAKHGMYHLKKVKRGEKKQSVAEILTFDYLKSVHKDMTVKEIAQETGCGASTVRKYLHGFGLSLKEQPLR